MPFTLKPEDIVITQYWPKPVSGFTASCPNGVKITHLPTGKWVKCDDHRSEHVNKAQAMRKLTNHVRMVYKPHISLSRGRVKYWKISVPPNETPLNLIPLWDQAYNFALNLNVP